MPLDNNIQIENSDELKNKIKETINYAQIEENNLSDNIIKNLNENQLSKLIDASLKNNGNWKSYTEMNQTPFYTFIVQASLDLVSDKIQGLNLDNKLRTSGGIDNKYGQGTSNAVKDFQRKCGLTIDGKAGKDFFNKIKELLGGSNEPAQKNETTDSNNTAHTQVSQEETEIQQTGNESNQDIGVTDKKVEIKIHKKTSQDAKNYMKNIEPYGASITGGVEYLNTIKNLLNIHGIPELEKLSTLIEKEEYAEVQYLINDIKQDGKFDYNTEKLIYEYTRNIILKQISNEHNGDSYTARKSSEQSAKSGWNNYEYNKVCGYYENKSNQEISIGKRSIEGGKSKMETGTIITGDTITFSNLYIMKPVVPSLTKTFEHAHVKYDSYNNEITINNEYIIQKNGYIRGTGEKEISDTGSYGSGGIQRQIVRKIYDYLNDNRIIFNNNGQNNENNLQVENKINNKSENENIQWKSISLIEESLPTFDVEQCKIAGFISNTRNKTGDIIINKIGKSGNKIFINDDIYLYRKNNDIPIKTEVYDNKINRFNYIDTGKREKKRQFIFAQKINDKWIELDIDNEYMQNGNKRKDVYNKLLNKF